MLFGSGKEALIVHNSALGVWILDQNSEGFFGEIIALMVSDNELDAKGRGFALGVN